MSDTYYRDAQKLGQREFRHCIARGQHPYLPLMDDFIVAGRLAQGRDLGTVQIPMEFIVGTRSNGRTNAFARNFMPLLPENTEFAVKWKHLCKSHLEEGIRDPVKAYEYMRRFYVEEGNKRVSVLKFFGAAAVPAHVIRILPWRNGSQEVELYYEYVDFYKYSKVNFLEFSRSGGYTQLQALLGKRPGEAWTDEDRSRFSTAYYYFRQAYEACGGKRLTTTVGDAMLAYIRVYGYQELRGRSEPEIKKSVSKVWKEITLQQEEQPIDVKLSPQEEKGGKLLERVLPKAGAKPLRAAFLYDKTPETSGWTRAHEQGRWHVEQVFHGELETASYENALEGDPRQVMEQAIADGNTVLFTTSPRLLSATLRTAVEHPEIALLNCSLNTSHRYIRTYYARIYEAKYIIGAIAGALARGGEAIGYICDYPIFGQVAGINAFALGVQLVNPTAKVFLEWSSVSGKEDALRHLTDRGIRLISALDMTGMERQDRSGFGLSMADGERRVILARPVWQWGVYYETLLRRMREGSFRREDEESGRALNYYWGMSAGVVEVHCSRKLPDGVRRLAELLRNAICSGSCEPFQGPLHAQKGQVLAGEGESLHLEQIIQMDWLNENITGMIPAYEDLSETGKGTVRIMGVGPSAQ